MAAESERAVFAFNTGEVSPKFGARSDVEKLSSSCRSLQNMHVSQFGTATRRQGFQYIATAKISSPASSP